MKTKLALAALIVCTGLYTLHAQDDKPTTNTIPLQFNASSIGQELIATLSTAFDERFSEYAAGLSDVTNVVRINQELYNVQIAHVDPNQRRTVINRFIDSAKRIEALAEQQVEIGTGTQTAVLEAKAARLQGQLALEKLKR